MMMLKDYFEERKRTKKRLSSLNIGGTIRRRKSHRAFFERIKSLKREIKLDEKEENTKIISLPQWSIYLSSTPALLELLPLEPKPYEIYIDGQQLDALTYLEFDTFGYIARKGISHECFKMNQDFIIIKNATKNINFFSIVDGHGYDCQQFHDLLKLYISLMILGNPRMTVFFLANAR